MILKYYLFNVLLMKFSSEGNIKLLFWEKYVSQRSKKVPGFWFSKNVFQVTLLMNLCCPKRSKKVSFWPDYS